MTSLARWALRRLRSFAVGHLADRVEVNSLLLARLLIERNLERRDVTSITEMEFRVFSQWGEDGIIQYLISRIPIANDVFVEFGVEKYRESNTKLLLLNDNWRGLIIDSSQSNFDVINRDEMSVKYDLTSVCQFVTRENINAIIASAGISGDIGVLSIDIDGNDYWVWEAIDVISPRIVICEYNSVFGAQRAVTIRYDPRFERTRAHHSNLYFGASLSALWTLGAKKGYDFVGSNSAGVNAFFVRKDLSDGLPKPSAESGYVLSRVRESMDAAGRPTRLSGQDRLRMIRGLQVVDVLTGERVTLADLLIWREGGARCSVLIEPARGFQTRLWRVL